MVTGETLRAIRDAAGVSLGQLVKLSDYSKGHLSRVENGLRPASPRLVRLYESLSARSVEFVVWGPALPSTAAHAVAATVESYGGEIRRARIKHALSLRRLAELSGISHTYICKIETGQILGSPYVASRLDNTLRQQGSLSDLYQREARLAPDTFQIPEPSILSAAVSQRSPDDTEATLASARLETLRAYRHLQGPHSVLPQVVSQLVGLHAAAAVASPSRAASIRNVEARLAEYLSWLAEEVSDMDAMRSWMAVAVQLGREGGDRRVAQYVAIRRSATALRVGASTDAVAWTRQVLSDSSLTLRLRRIALHHEAKAHAKRGDHKAFRSTMDAYYALPDESDVPPSGDWEWGPPPDSQVTSSGLAEATGLMELGDYRAAALLFATALPSASVADQSLSPLARNTNVRFAIREAITYAHINECDRAADVIESLLPAIAPASSTVVRQDLRRLASIIARRRTPRLQALAPDVVTLARSRQPRTRVRRTGA
ncbi:transcriptional regulator with XRE-family HTH domain [Catenulispora sp. MAP12-49]|uniref:helix-turn-helix domain-containing protein n=1 Tax=unclassified Catenulispora TaxID=414885 RepID=UPI003514F043